MRTDAKIGGNPFPQRRAQDALPKQEHDQTLELHTTYTYTVTVKGQTVYKEAKIDLYEPLTHNDVLISERIHTE